MDVEEKTSLISSFVAGVGKKTSDSKNHIQSASEKFRTQKTVYKCTQQKNIPQKTGVNRLRKNSELKRP